MVVLVAIGALALAPASGRAAVPDTVALEALTWTELQESIRSGWTTVIVPTGGTEQNGPHMALGKHNARVKALAALIARAVGNALVAPVVAYVPEGGLAPPTGHMRFPGTITVAEDAFERVLEWAARSLRLHGFRDIVLIGDSGPNQPGQQAVAARLNREWAGTPVRVHAVDEYYRASTDGVRELLRSKGYRDDEIGRHAGLADTSLMLAIDPALVRADRVGRDAGPAATSGVDGDPRRASAALGRLGVEAIVSRTARAIQRAIANR
jgi:creatinine amidohydrolase/Fe(II)-dependent formamide hydrolase-like protein